jgi:hypothetical protein
VITKIRRKQMSKEIEKLSSIYDDFNKLLKKHGFKKLAPYCFDTREPFSSYVFGVSPDDPSILIMGISNKEVCPCCAEKKCNDEQEGQ